MAKKQKIRIELPKGRQEAKYIRRFRTLEGKLEYEYPKEESVEQEISSKARNQKDLELWTLWKKTKDPNVLDELYERFQPLIHSQANKYLSAGLRIPPHSIEAEFYKHFVRAIETYDPKKGVNLATHVYAQLQAVHRFIATHQNLARIPENRIFRIGQFQRAESELQSQLGRPPTDEEMAKFLKWKISDIVKMKKSLAKDISQEAFPVNPFSFLPSTRQATEIVMEELEPFDREVLKRLIQGIKNKDIAKQLKSNPAAVTRAKQRIIARLKEYLGES